MTHRERRRNAVQQILHPSAEKRRGPHTLRLREGPAVARGLRNKADVYLALAQPVGTPDADRDAILALLTYAVNAPETATAEEEEAAPP